jgi:hypothetical protein
MLVTPASSCSLISSARVVKLCSYHTPIDWLFGSLAESKSTALQTLQPPCSLEHAYARLHQYCNCSLTNVFFWLQVGRHQCSTWRAACRTAAACQLSCVCGQLQGRAQKTFIALVKTRGKSIPSSRRSNSRSSSSNISDIALRQASSYSS